MLSRGSTFWFSFSILHLPLDLESSRNQKAPSVLTPLSPKICSIQPGRHVELCCIQAAGSLGQVAGIGAVRGAEGNPWASETLDVKGHCKGGEGQNGGP